VRDHRQRKEAHGHERRPHVAAEPANRGGRGVEVVGHGLRRAVRHEPRERQRQRRDHLAAVGHRDAAAHVGHGACRDQGVIVIGGDDHDVVTVVGDARGHRPAPQPEAAHEAHADVAGRAMALDDAHAQHVPAGIGDRDPVGDADGLDVRRREELILDDAHHARAPPARDEAQVCRPRDVEGVRQRRIRAGAVAQPAPVPRHDTAPGDDEIDAELPQIRRDEQVGAPAGRHGPAVAQPVVLRRIERRHRDRRHGIETGADRQSHERVDRSVAEKLPGHPVVGRERAAPRGVLVHRREHVDEVPRVGRLAQEHGHAEPQLLARLRRRDGFVIARDARAHVRLEVGAGEPGDVAVQRPPREGADLGEHVLAPGQDAGEVHDLREAEHARVLRERDEVRRVQPRPGRLHRRRRHARRRHDEHREVKIRAGVEHVADPRRAEHVRDLVRIAHDRRHAVWQDRVGEAMRREHRDLDVHVGVDQPGADVRAVEVDDLACGPLAESDDAVTVDRDGGRHDLVREHVDNASAAQQEVGLDRAARGPDELSEVVHRMCD